VNILYLVEQELLDLPVLYLSKYIIENKSEYYQALLNVTREQAWEEWILFMLRAVESTALWTRDKVAAIVRLEKMTIDYIQSDEELNKIYSRELVDTIFQKPYCRVSNLVDGNIGQRQTAMKYLKLLTEHGILTSLPLGREKLFINRRLMDLLMSDSHSFSQF
jgi:Fic family protein